MCRVLTVSSRYPTFVLGFALGFALPAHAQLKPAVLEADRATQQGLTLYRDGDLDGAAQAFQKAIALTPKDGLPYFDLGMVLFDKGDLPKAAQAYEAAVALLEKQNLPRMNLSQALNNLALVYYRQNRLDDADSRIDRAMQAWPASPDPWVTRGLIFEARQTRRCHPCL
jgi:Flp pilus assembly protein TadD